MKSALIALLAFCVCLPLVGADKKKPGTVLWEFETGGDVSSSPAIGPDGTVYFGSTDNKLYAIKTDSKGLAKSPWPMRGQNTRHTGESSLSTEELRALNAEFAKLEKAMKEKAAASKTELEALKKKARNGDTRAMLDVTRIYLTGKNGVKKDFFMASLYYEASELMIRNGKIRGASGIRSALYSAQLKEAVSKGDLTSGEVKESQELAKTLVKEAEENWLKQDPTALNDPEQQKELAIRYLRGEGVQKNAKLALGLLLKSLPPKYDPNTLVIIGGMYDAEQFKDEAIEPSPANAMKYNLMAAYQNNAIAQRAIGDLYSKGIGVQKDLIKEYAWYSLSSNNGDEQGEQSRAAAQKELGFDDLLKAKAQANQIKTEIEKRMKEIADIRKAANDGLLKSIRNGDNQEKAKIFEKLSKDVEAVLLR